MFVVISELLILHTDRDTDTRPVWLLIVQSCLLNEIYIYRCMAHVMCNRLGKFEKYCAILIITVSVCAAGI